MRVSGGAGREQNRTVETRDGFGESHAARSEMVTEDRTRVV